MYNDKTVLIVEDSITVRFQIKIMLEEIGVKLKEAGGEIGLFNLIEEYGQTADLIIMDLTLKSENGLDLIKKLRTHHAYKQIPIIVLTEHADANHVLAAKDLGVEDYIRKPINKDLIVERVTNLLIQSMEKQLL